MKASILSAAAVSAPSVGPAIVTIFGVDFPVLAFGASVCGLILARVVAPPPLRKLSRLQEVALTGLLLIILTMIVTGQFGDGEPMAAGTATVFGIGLGFSGLLAIEFFGERAMSMIRALFGRER